MYTGCLKVLDLIYYDIKHMNSEQHRKFTGHDNKLILENFMRLSEKFKELQARMPIIPGMNDDINNIRETASFLKKQGKETIHCLPYHQFGEAKLNRINSGQKSLGLKSRSSEDLVYVKEAFQKEGINASIYD